MRPKTREGSDAANRKILLAFQERIYLLCGDSTANEGDCYLVPTTDLGKCVARVSADRKGDRFRRTWW